MTVNISYTLRALCVAVFSLLLGAFSINALADVETKQSSQGLVLDTNGGFSLESKDGKYGFNIGGRVQYDYRSDEGSFTRSSNGSTQEEYDARRLRLNLKGHALGWKFKLGYDFRDASGDSDSGSGVTDAYVQYTGFGQWAILTLGRHKVPFVMDELTSSRDVLSLERNILAQAFAPSRTDGISLGGYSKNFTYKVSVWSEEEERGQNADVSYGGRVTWAPLYDRDNIAVHLGVSALKRDISVASRVGGVNVPVAGLSVRTESRSADELLVGALVYDGITASGVEFGLTSRGILFQAEYVEQEYEDWSASSGNLPDFGASFHGYSGQISWVITGESHSYDNQKGVFKRITPLTDAGAWEVFARYSSLDLRTGQILNNVDDIADRYTGATYGVTWYANNNTRVTLNYITAEIERYTTDAATSEVSLDSQLIDGDSFALRLQYVF